MNNERSGMNTAGQHLAIFTPLDSSHKHNVVDSINGCIFMQPVQHTRKNT